MPEPVKVMFYIILFNLQQKYALELFLYLFYVETQASKG